MKQDIKTLAQEKKFGEIEKAVYEDRSLIGELVGLLGEKDNDVRSGVLNLLSRVGFDYPNDTRPHLGTLIALLDDEDMFVKIDAANAVGRRIPTPRRSPGRSRSTATYRLRSWASAAERSRTTPRRASDDGSEASQSTSQSRRASGPATNSIGVSVEAGAALGAVRSSSPWIVCFLRFMQDQSPWRDERQRMIGTRLPVGRPS